MAINYCDHGLYGAPVAAGTVPSAAEDGNGKAKTAATMATLVIDFSGIPAADGAVTIAGVTFTAKASGATGNQFNAVTSAATCATNLRNAINASATNATKPTGALGPTVPLRNIVNATVSGAVVTVYTRVCGSEWNSVTETSTLTNATLTQWSGGADGAWGYFINPSTIAWPTSVAAGGYGIFSALRPYLGALVAGDTIKVRSAKTISVGVGIAVSTASLSTGTAAAPIHLIIDDGTEWPADGATPVLRLNHTMNNNQRLGDDNNRHYSLRAKRYSYTEFGFFYNAINSGFSMGLLTAGCREYVGCYFKSAAYTSISNNTFTHAYNEMASFRQCKIEAPSGIQIVASAGNTYDTNISFTDVEFSNTGNAGNNVLFAGAASTQNVNLYYDSCRWTDHVGGSITGKLTNGIARAYFRNCDFGNIGVLGHVQLAAIQGVIAGSSQYGSRDFFINTIFGFVEWTSTRGFPTLNARLLDGTTPWSIHAVPTTASANTRYQGLDLPRIAKINSLASGVRTLTIELAIHEALTWDLNDIAATIDYIDTDGNRQVIETYDYAGAALTASTASWSSETGGQVTYVDNSLVQYHNKFKFSVTTPTAIATGTEVGIIIRSHANVAAMTHGYFVDPEIQVA